MIQIIIRIKFDIQWVNLSKTLKKNVNFVTKSPIKKKFPKKIGMNYEDLYNLHLVDVTQSHCGQRNQKNRKTKNQKGLQIKLRLESQRLEIQHN